MVMHGGEVEPPPGLKPHVRVKLKPGWRYRPRKGRFVSDRGGEMAPGDELPEGSRIVAVAPELARARRGSLTPDEEDLARWLQVILPEGADPEPVGALVARWRCVEKTEKAPDVRLPGNAGSPPAPALPVDSGRE